MNTSDNLAERRKECCFCVQDYRYLKTTWLFCD